MMPEIVYFCCAALSLACALMLFREYHSGKTRLLLWSSICFAFLALNNIFIIVDLVVFPDLELNGPGWRNIVTSIAGGTMLFGLIWELT